MSTGDSAVSNASFADALDRARQLAAKIGSGEKRPLDNGDGSLAKRNINDGVAITTLGQSGAVPSSGMDPVVVEQFQVPDSMVGLIIGRGGEQISNIQAQSHCRVQMAQDSGGLPDRQVTLTGTKTAIEEAKELMRQIIQRNDRGGGGIGGGGGGGGTGGMIGSANAMPPMPGGGQLVEEILLPGPKVGLVIGKGGENLKRIQAELGVRMIVIQDNNIAAIHDKPLRIIGPADKVEQARQQVVEVMNSKDDSLRGFNDFSSIAQKSVGEVIVPRIAVGVIIGKGGDMIKKIQNESGARVQFKLGENPDGPERTAVLTGTQEQIQKATGMITELVNQAVMKQGGVMPMSTPGSLGGIAAAGSGRQEIFYMHVPSNKTGLVIGKGGETIRQINTESGAHVELSREPPPNEFEKIFIIKGNSQSINHAQHLIRIKVGDIPPGTPVGSFQQNGPGPGIPAPSVSAAPQAIGFTAAGQPGGQPNPAFSYAAPQSVTAATTAAAQDPNSAAWAAYYAQYYQQTAAAAGGYATGQPTQSPASQPQPTAANPAAPSSQPQPSQTQTAPAVNPLTGQPDYSAQWAEYYRSLGMHEQAALIEQQAKANQAAAAAQAAGATPAAAAAAAAQPQPQAQASAYAAAYPQPTGYAGIPGQQSYPQPY